MDHIAHSDGLDGRTFHLVDPQPKSVAETANVFARTAHAPRFVLRFDLNPRALVPSPVRALARGPLRLAAAALGRGLGIPPRILSQGNPVTHFDCSQTTEALEGTGIEVPPLEDYAQRLWTQWESNHDAELGHSRSLRRAVKGKRVLITGGTGFLGQRLTRRLVELGAVVTVTLCGTDGPAQIASLPPECDRREGDVRNYDQMCRLVEQVAPDFLFHLAAVALLLLLTILVYANSFQGVFC